MASTNGESKWFIRIVVTLILLSIPAMGSMLWSVSSKADEQNHADIKAIAKHIEDKFEAKESHDKDIELIEVKFEFIKTQLAAIERAVKR